MILFLLLLANYSYLKHVKSKKQKAKSHNGQIMNRSEETL